MRHPRHSTCNPLYSLLSPAMPRTCGALMMFAAFGVLRAATAQELPPAASLPVHSELPDPLVTFAGAKVASREQWTTQRRPELIRLFQHYMYGQLPAAPANLKFEVERVDTAYFGGKATKREVTIAFGPPQAPRISLLVVVPNRPAG